VHVAVNSQGLYQYLITDFGQYEQLVSVGRSFFAAVLT
jgi:hypothetical protein